MTVEEIQEEIIDEFSLFENKNDQYSYIIELGKALPDLEDQDHTDENIVKGCQSQVWLVAELKDNQLYFKGDSDSTLVKGLLSLLIKVLSGKSPQEVLDTDLHFIDKIGLRQMLSMNRAGGLAAMVKQMKFFALAYQSKLGG